MDIVSCLLGVVVTFTIIGELRLPLVTALWGVSNDTFFVATL